MRFNITPEWLERMCKLEDEVKCPILAGSACLPDPIREDILTFLKAGPRSPRDIEKNAIAHGLRGTFPALSRLLNEGKVVVTGDFHIALGEENV